MSRVAFDDDMPKDGGAPLSSSVSPLQPAALSPHWQGLHHQEGDVMIETMDDLKASLVSDLSSSSTTRPNNRGEILALWSCVAGLSEALATHKQQRYHIFPIPLGALRRLIQEEFVPRIQSVSIGSLNPTHRETVQAIANLIWAHALNKPNTRDEIHANSVYVWLRGRIDRKSLDCFGAALTTIAGCHVRGMTSSQLTLSEDHAYERHIVVKTPTSTTVGTCEVAVPGTTKAAQAKRGREIGDTFSKEATLTPQTSWLYMAANPVVCDSVHMTLVAVIGNINCTIEKQSSSSFLASGQLYDLKRDLLWILYDHGAMSKFPFGLLELGDCEENRGSPRSEEWVQVDNISEPILQNEKLFLDAIHINKTLYDEAQVYPYFYAGHYHKDAGNEGPEHEYRLVHAMKQYADAARVASKYRYEGIDSLQLNKHMSVAAMLIAQDILTPKYKNNNNATKEGAKKEEPRQWVVPENALSAGTWLLGFFDSLLYWEESSSSTGKQFVEILTPSHKYGIGKLFQLFDQDTRLEIVNRVTGSSMDTEEESKQLPASFCQVRSKRLAESSMLSQALKKPRVSIREIELAIPSTEDESGSRRSKRMRR